MSEARAGVLEALQCACSQDPSVLKVGEHQLKSWENEKGFYVALAVRLGSEALCWYSCGCLYRLSCVFMNGNADVSQPRLASSSDDSGKVLWRSCSTFHGACMDRPLGPPTERPRCVITH